MRKARLKRYPERLWTTINELMIGEPPENQTINDRLLRLFAEIDHIYLGDICNMTKKELLTYPGIGEKAIAQIQRLLEKEGYQLGMKIQNWQIYRKSLYPNLLHEMKIALHDRGRAGSQEIRRWIKHLERIDYRHGNKAILLETESS